MLTSIVAYGLAMGGVYALIGITYNVMFIASRVFSFTAGVLGMLGGVVGALFITRLGFPVLAGFLAMLACCAVIGIVTEIVCVRPVLGSLEKHLYVLSTLALALMLQQFIAIKWSTEPQPFPRLIPWSTGVADQRFWLPVLGCAVTVAGLEFLVPTAPWWGAHSWPSPRTISRRARWACRSRRCGWRATPSRESSAAWPDSPAERCCSPTSPTRRC